MEEEVK
jgi:hypothetical protein